MAFSFMGVAYPHPRKKTIPPYLLIGNTYDVENGRNGTSIIKNLYEDIGFGGISNKLQNEIQTMPAKSTWNTHKFTLHLISFIPFMKKNWYFSPLPPKTMLMI